MRLGFCPFIVISSGLGLGWVVGPSKTGEGAQTDVKLWVFALEHVVFYAFYFSLLLPMFWLFFFPSGEDGFVCRVMKGMNSVVVRAFALCVKRGGAG